jgi:hypothetical protein
MLPNRQVALPRRYIMVDEGMRLDPTWRVARKRQVIAPRALGRAGGHAFRRPSRIGAVMLNIRDTFEVCRLLSFGEGHPEPFPNVGFSHTDPWCPMFRGFTHDINRDRKWVSLSAKSGSRYSTQSFLRPSRASFESSRLFVIESC